MKGGGGGVAEDEVIFNTIFGHFFAVLLVNLDKSESEFQKYINHKFS